MLLAPSVITPGAALTMQSTRQALGYYTSQHSAAHHILQPALGNLKCLCNQFDDICQSATYGLERDEEYDKALLIGMNRPSCHRDPNALRFSRLALPECSAWRS